jgi:hypothetical protein
MSTTEEIMTIALETLKHELKEEPLSPAKVTALAEVIKALSGVNPLSRP